MKTKLLLLLSILISVNSFSQITFQTNVITTGADGARSVLSVDIDGDNIVD